MRRNLRVVSLLVTSVMLFYGSRELNATDIYYNMEQVSNVSVGNCAYIWGWYEPDSANYFVFSGLWHGETPAYSGVAVIKVTDPANPIIVDTIVTPMAQDLKIVGNMLYAIDWAVPSGNYLWIIPLQSAWPYYNAGQIKSIPFVDTYVDTIGSCDTLPLNTAHTIFATDEYIFITEKDVGPDGWEVAALDIATDPENPRLMKVWNAASVGNDWFNWPHSVYCQEDTVYLFVFWGNIYKGIINSSGGIAEFNYQGKIGYDSFRNDLNDLIPNEILTCPDSGFEWVSEPKRSISHSGWLSHDGDYLFTADEADNGCPYWGYLMGGFVRVFHSNDFDFDSLSAPIVNAFDISWNYILDQDTALYGIDAIDTLTHCPDPIAPCFVTSHDAMPLGVHDVIARNNLLFCSWYDRGIHVLDISNLPNLNQVAYADHNCGPSDTWTSEAYSEYPLSPDGYIYQGGVNGLYIYQLGETGLLSSSTTWYGDHYVYDTFTISSGQTLTLASGAHIYLYKNALLEVNGTLVANGTPSDSVKFICLGGNPAPGDWQGIYVGENAACTLSYCILTNAQYGVEGRTGSHVSVSHSNISNNSTAGLYSHKGYLSVSNSAINNNLIYGVWGYNADVDVDHCRLINNRSYGILIGGSHTSDSTFVTYDTVSTSPGFEFPLGYSAIRIGSIDAGKVYKCKAGGHYQNSLYLYNSDIFVGNNDFSKSGYYGIYADNGSSPKVRQCRIDSLDVGL